MDQRQTNSQADNQEEQPRSPRKKRAQRTPRYQDEPTERDIQILEALLDNRRMTIDQITALFFGSKSSASIRMRKLYDYGLVMRTIRSMNHPAIYGIDYKGVVTLRKRGVESAMSWHSSNKSLTE